MINSCTVGLTHLRILEKHTRQDPRQILIDKDLQHLLLLVPCCSLPETQSPQVDDSGFTRRESSPIAQATGNSQRTSHTILTRHGDLRMNHMLEAPSDSCRFWYRSELSKEAPFHWSVCQCISASLSADDLLIGQQLLSKLSRAHNSTILVEADLYTVRAANNAICEKRC